jgi:hypothetical protein
MRIIWILFLLLIVSPVTTFAAGSFPDEDGFSGYFLLGVGRIDLESNIMAGNDIMDVGNPVVSSVFTSPQSKEDTHFAATGEIRYTYADRKMQIFAGNSIEDLLQMDINQRIGFSKQLDHAGTVSFAYVLNAISAIVWEDPYVANVTRQETDRNSEGFRFEWDQMMNTGFGLEFTYRDIDVDVERSGESLGLSAANRALLNREGDRYSLAASYQWIPSPGHIIESQIGFRSDDRDGDAIKSDGYWVQLTYMNRKDRWTFIANGRLGKNEHEADNPIYNLRQDSVQTIVGATVSYRLPYADQRWAATGLVTYGESDSDIDFHDSKVFSTIIGLAYRF